MVEQGNDPRHGALAARNLRLALRLALLAAIFLVAFVIARMW